MIARKVRLTPRDPLHASIAFSPATRKLTSGLIMRLATISVGYVSNRSGQIGRCGAAYFTNSLAGTLP